MGYRLVTASASLVLVNSNIRTNPIKLTCVIVTPENESCTSAYVTLYNATAATADTEFMSFRCGTAGKTVTWQDSTSGVVVAGGILFVTINSAYATLVWD